MDAQQKCETLWRWLRGLYGKGLEMEFGSTMPDAWRASIGGLSAEQLRKGCRALASSGSPYPPKLPVFLEMCGANEDRPMGPAHNALPPPEPEERERYERIYSSAAIERMVQERIDANPQWKRRAHETSAEYAERMLAECRRISPGAGSLVGRDRRAPRPGGTAVLP